MEKKNKEEKLVTIARHMQLLIDFAYLKRRTRKTKTFFITFYTFYTIWVKQHCLFTDSNQPTITNEPDRRTEFIVCMFIVKKVNGSCILLLFRDQFAYLCRIFLQKKRKKNKQSWLTFLYFQLSKTGQPRQHSSVIHTIHRYYNGLTGFSHSIPEDII